MDFAMPSLVAGRPFRPPPSIHFCTAICAFASSCRSRLAASSQYSFFSARSIRPGECRALRSGCCSSSSLPGPDRQGSPQCFPASSPKPANFCASSRARSIMTSMLRTSADQQRFHHRNHFLPIFSSRSNVLFHVHILNSTKMLIYYIIYMTINKEYVLK